MREKGGTNMTIWDEVKRSVDDISDVAKEVANLLAEKTDEISREGKLKLEIFNLQRQVRSNETKLGRRMYDLWSGDPKAVPVKDDEASGYLDSLKGLYGEIKTREEEVEASRKTKSEKAGEGKDETPAD
jgi:hypothetical protein